MSNLLQFAFILLSICCGCKPSTTTADKQPCISGSFEIRPVRDTTPYRQVIGIEFLCDSNRTFKTLRFIDGNPWRQCDFPLLPEKNDYLGYNNTEHYNTSLIQGHIPFDLNGATWNEVRNKFKIESNLNLDSFRFAYAKTDCRYAFALPDLALTNYHLQLQGSTDTLRNPYLQLFIPESQLVIYNSQADTVFSIYRYNTAFTGASIDSTHRYLFLRSFQTNMQGTYNGLEVHDIINDSMIFQLEYDSNFLVKSPVMYGNYVVYEILQNNPRKGAGEIDRFLYQTLVYDIVRKKMFKHTLTKHYSFFSPSVSSHYLIYSKGDDEVVPLEYDSIAIQSLVDL